MLLIDNCNYTLLSFIEAHKKFSRIECSRPGDIKNLHEIILSGRYRFIIVSFECISKLSLLHGQKKPVRTNFKTKVIVASDMNWPLEGKPLELSSGIYLAGRSDISRLLRMYINGTIKNYFADAKVFSCSNQEKEVLRMIINQEEKINICKKLKIKDKTISSHISNMKKKASTNSFLLLAVAFNVKYNYLSFIE